jgi:stress-induced morphogen
MPKYEEKKNKWTNGIKAKISKISDKFKFHSKKNQIYDIEENKEIELNLEPDSFEVIGSPQRHNTVNTTNPEMMEEQSS